MLAGGASIHARRCTKSTIHENNYGKIATPISPRAENIFTAEEGVLEPRVVPVVQGCRTPLALGKGWLVPAEFAVFFPVGRIWWDHTPVGMRDVLRHASSLSSGKDYYPTGAQFLVRVL